ncbi:MAG: acyl-CoA dehydrogenase family protein [Caldilineaceae bacterium]|nr:acyl-CoA dehydrogenase family protein [Caldilineaceae bacterium]MCY4092937.1 acyl-CoA dehydrogenase family protein [Caldilineaceae bacterium]MDE0069385.1 acyl-CoA dehydrogenase family protein [Caldilineaceae bacterium]MDE0430018.1 acyl-CoA dehydrogenase family protein [Caldilineaceae bacterium]
MMNDKLSDLLPRVRQVVDAEVIPLEKLLISRPWAEVEPIFNQKRDVVREAGLWGLALPVAYGGQGLTLAEFGRVSEVLGRTPGGHYVFGCQAPDMGNMELLVHAGTEDQRARFLLPLARGEVRSCFAMTEPEHAGSNPTWMSTTALRDGDQYVINGHKWFTTAAEGAAFAVVMAVTNPDAESRHARASQIIVPLDTPGFHIERNISVMGEAHGGWNSHAEVWFEDVRVPQENLIGEEGKGFALAQLRLGPGRIHHCMRWIGICERAFDIMCSRAARREVAPGRLLGGQGMVQAWIAESRAEINAARLMVLDTAQKIDSEGIYAARDEISLIKFFAAEVLMRVLDKALQTLGGLGMSDDTPIAFWYRHERASRIYDGPDEVHKMSVARRILRRYQ